MTTLLNTRNAARAGTLVVLLALAAWFSIVVWFATSPPEGGRVVVDPSPPSSIEVLSGRP